MAPKWTFIDISNPFQRLDVSFYINTNVAYNIDIYDINWYGGSSTISNLIKIQLRNFQYANLNYEGSL